MEQQKSDEITVSEMHCIVSEMRQVTYTMAELRELFPEEDGSTVDKLITLVEQKNARIAALEAELTREKEEAK